jgi:hypothetical protein
MSNSRNCGGSKTNNASLSHLTINKGSPQPQPRSRGPLFGVKVTVSKISSLESLTNQRSTSDFYGTKGVSSSNLLTSARDQNYGIVFAPTEFAWPSSQATRPLRFNFFRDGGFNRSKCTKSKATCRSHFDSMDLPWLK